MFVVSLIEEAYKNVRKAKRLLISVFSLVAFNFSFNAGHALEVINAPTIDPNKVEAQASEQAYETSFGTIKAEDIYDGPGLEIPNLIDVIKEKTNIGTQKAITPEEAAP